ncbi:MAG: hypothetical protein LBV58_03540 [Acholeplasmatales bacterium]|jgi:hypothetical protein|nr:hypothetical protein [Acholeplasmatales bacterium]
MNRKLTLFLTIIIALFSIIIVALVGVIGIDENTPTITDIIFDCEYILNEDNEKILKLNKSDYNDIDHNLIFIPYHILPSIGIGDIKGTTNVSGSSVNNNVGFLINPDRIIITIDDSNFSKPFQLRIWDARTGVVETTLFILFVVGDDPVVIPPDL